MAPIIEEECEAIAQEVEEALDLVTLDKDNVKIYLKISSKGKEVVWMPVPSKKCFKPLYVH